MKDQMENKVESNIFCLLNLSVNALVRTSKITVNKIHSTKSKDISNSESPLILNNKLSSA